MKNTDLSDQVLASQYFAIKDSDCDYREWLDRLPISKNKKSHLTQLISGDRMDLLEMVKNDNLSLNAANQKRLGKQRTYQPQPQVQMRLNQFTLDQTDAFCQIYKKNANSRKCDLKVEHSGWAGLSSSPCGLTEHFPQALTRLFEDSLISDHVAFLCFLQIKLFARSSALSAWESFFEYPELIIANSFSDFREKVLGNRVEQKKIRRK